MCAVLMTGRTGVIGIFFSMLLLIIFIKKGKSLNSLIFINIIISIFNIKSSSL